MPYKAELIGQVFFIRWDAVPTPREASEVRARVAEAAATLGTSRPTFVCSVMETAKVPDSRERELIHGLVTAVRRHCQRSHMVLEGNELQHHAQRLIMSAALLIMRIQEKDFLQVHRSAETVARALRAELMVDGAELIRQARARGLVA